jgi:putative membrane protein
MRRFIALAGFILAVSPALAQSVGEKTGVNSVLGVSPTTADFVKEAASSDMFEIQSSQLAEQRATDQATKDFAARMIADHQKTTNDIKGMISSGAVKAEVPTEMIPTHAALFDKLKGLNGGDFEKQYHDDQVTAHKQAVSLYERYAKGGDNTGLKDWTGKTQPILEEHLKMAQDLDK